MARGRKIHTGKFDTRWELEQEIMRLQHTGWTHGTIGRICGVSESLVCQIYNQHRRDAELRQAIAHQAKNL